MKRIVLVANDVSPSIAFGALSKSLSWNGFVVTGYLGMGKLETHESQLAEWIPGASFVLVGMSSSPELAQKELFVLEQAKKHGISYGLYSDTFRCYQRDWFLPHGADASLLFIASEAERVDAEEQYPHAHVVVSGNPSWEDLRDEGKSRTQIYSKFEDLDREIILVPFNKTHKTNADLALRTISALRNQDVHIVFALHPGEIKQNAGCQAEYQREIFEQCGKNISATFGFLPEGLTPKDVLRVATLVVSACSPTTDLQAALLGVPVVNYIAHPDTQARLLNEFGGLTSDLCELGAAVSVMHEAEIERVFCEDLRQVTRRQRVVFPVIPQKGHAVIQMTNAFLLMFALDQVVGVG